MNDPIDGSSSTGTAPGRAHDSGIWPYVAQSFIPIWDGGDPETCSHRLRRLADGYGLDQDQRRRLPGLITAHTRGMFNLLRGSAATGLQPWADLDQRGHGAVWYAAANFTANHMEQWINALTA